MDSRTVAVTAITREPLKVGTHPTSYSPYRIPSCSAITTGTIRLNFFITSHPAATTRRIILLEKKESEVTV